MMYHTPPEPQPTQTLSMQNYGEHENMATKSYRHKTIIKFKKEKKKCDIHNKYNLFKCV